MSERQVFRPQSEAEAAEFVARARADRRKLDVVGNDTRNGLARPPAGDADISTAGLAGIVFYEPTEMVIRAGAGTPLSQVEARIAQSGQMLPFEPPDPRPLYGTSGEPTIGGLIASGFSGPRRISAGALRDSLIGLRFINGRGEAIESGGRVMKNVTGLDLVKIHAGAHGTLGLITQATFKLLPRPEAEATIIIRHVDAPTAVTALTRALGSPFGVSGAAYLSAGMGREFPRAVIRIEGFAESVAYRRDKLIGLLAEFGAKHAVEGTDSQRMWKSVRDLDYLVSPRERAIWRLSVAPSLGPQVLMNLRSRALGHMFDWGGGLVWIAAAPTPEDCAAVRSAIVAVGGHATLIRAPAALRAQVAVFEPQKPGIAALTKKLRGAFDPDHLFNVGRMEAEA